MVDGCLKPPPGPRFLKPTTTASGSVGVSDFEAPASPELVPSVAAYSGSTRMRYPRAGCRLEVDYALPPNET